MSKRTRNEISQSEAYDTPTYTQLKSYEKGRDVPKKYAIYKSIPNKLLQDNFNFRTLRDLLFPIFKTSIDRQAWCLTNFSQFTGVNYDRLDETRFFTSNDNKQGWATFITLPARNLATLTNPVTGFQNGFVTLHDLVAKVRDVNNIAMQTTPDAVPTFIADSERNLIYLGGKARYTIINTNTVDITVTTHVSKPKHMLLFDTIANTNPLQFYRTLPAHFALDDKLTQKPNRETLYPISQLSFPNNSNDLTFNYETTDSRRLYNYNTVSKTHRLVPGQVLEVVLDIPPFTFTESAFFLSMQHRNLSSERPMFLPFCTQILDIQWKGELVHTPAFDVVGNSETQIQIHRRETHTIRAGIYNPPYQQLIEYQNDGINMPTDVHTNEETQETITDAI